MNKEAITKRIVTWLKDYVDSSGLSGYVVGVSGGIDSALTATLCAMSGKNVVLVNMPIRQKPEQFRRASRQISSLETRFPNVKGYTVDLTPTFEQLSQDLPGFAGSHDLSMANSRARLRMTALYAIGQSKSLLVAGTGNKVEDFGVGFFTKYGDGGVDLSPIADLMKTEVFEMATFLGVNQDILDAPPTDGLWEDDRNDEDQLGASYAELEWAMEFDGDESVLSENQKRILAIYKKFHAANKHKMDPIPVCSIPKTFKN